MSTPSGCESLYAVSVPMSAGPWCSFSKSLRVQWPLQWQPTTWGSTSATTHGARGENGNFTYLVSMLSDCALEQHSCLRIFCCRFESPSAVTQLDALAYVCIISRLRVSSGQIIPPRAALMFSWAYVYVCLPCWTHVHCMVLPP